MMRLYLIISLLSLSISLPASVSTPLSSRRGDCGETPQTLAKHFCRLLVCDNDHRVMPLSAFIRQQTPLSDDSLTIEQLFTTYVFDYQGWQTLRIFPHQAADGTIRWYAPTDPLPKDMSEEHSKYIHEVFPRLIMEMEASNWATAEAYIDRMMQYQCQFGGKKLTTQPSSFTIIGIILLFFVLSFIVSVVPPPSESFSA